MGRGNSVDYAPNTLLSVIGLMKGNFIDYATNNRGCDKFVPHDGGNVLTAIWQWLGCHMAVT